MVLPFEDTMKPAPPTPGSVGPIYAITDPDLLPGKRLVDGVKQALDAGIHTIQYRDKPATPELKLERAMALSTLCNHYGAQLIINDDAKLAKAVNAAGVHLGQSDQDIQSARALLGPNAIIGVTCHDSLDLAQHAAVQGANYVAFGRFYPSHTKAFAPAAPLSILTEANVSLTLPTVAIGGITVDNMAPLKIAGAQSVAVCHNLFGATDIAAACQRFIRRWNQTYV